MGIVIILTYVFFLFVPLFVLWRSIINNEIVNFSTIKYQPVNIIIDNNIEEEISLDIIDDNEEKLFEDVE